MDDIVREISIPELVIAADANLKVAATLNARFIQGYQFFDDAEFTGCLEPQGGGIFRASFSSEQTGEKIRDVLQFYRSKGCLPMFWLVSPASQPMDQGKQLIQQGFRLDASFPVMAVHLRDLQSPLVLPDGFVIERIHDLAHLQQWVEVLLSVNEISEPKVKELSEILQMTGFGSEAPFQLFVGVYNGRPVATSRLHYGGGVAGIYYVITLPDFRGRGFGTAMTLAAAHAGLEAGYHVGVLFSTDQGYRLYHRLGFQEYFHNDMYLSQE